MSYYVKQLFSPIISTTTVVTGLVQMDVSNLDKMVITYQNQNTSNVDFLHIQVEARVATLSAGIATEWFSITAVASVNSALSAHDIFATTAINNVYKDIRINATVSTSETTFGTLVVTVAGHQRF